MNDQDILNFYVNESDTGSNAELEFKPDLSQYKLQTNPEAKKKKISITIDQDLYNKLSEKAKKEKRSFSSLMCYCSELGLDNLDDTWRI